MKKTTEFYDKINSQIILFSNKNCYNNTNNKEIIKSIHDNLNAIENGDRLNQDILNKIMTPEKLLKEYLIFDLLNYNPEEYDKIKTLQNAINFGCEVFKKYQYKVGGYSIEDIDWILADKNNQRFKVKDNQMILYNSVHKKNCDRDLIWFFDSIQNYINRHVDKNKIKVKYSMFEDERNCFCWIVYKFTKMSNEDDSIESLREKLYDQVEKNKEKEKEE